VAPVVDDRRQGGALGSVLLVLAVSIPTGYLVVHGAEPMTRNRYFPWIVGRSLGLAAYVTLTTLVALGLWLRHPWRSRVRVLHAEVRLRVHSALAVATCILVGGHVVALAADRYAGVPWPVTLIPGASSYRPVAVGLGVVGLYFMAVLSLTAMVGGRLIGRHWLLVHQLALPTFALLWFHAVLAGSDSIRLRAFYALTGFVVGALVVTRVWVAGRGPRATHRPNQPVVAAARFGAMGFGPR